jgi:four helix bundle protein
MLHFQRLDVYRCAVQFLALALEITRRSPRGYGPVMDQLRRAALSIPLNVAEATGRTGEADAARTFAIARGSAMECAAILDALALMAIVSTEQHDRGCNLLEREVSMLSRLCHTHD